MKNEIRNKIERWKLKCDLFLKENSKVYIKDINDQYYFCEILFCGDNKLEIKCFAPEEKKGKTYELFWFDIVLLEPYKEKEELK